MSPYIAEFLGMMILILLDDGAVANVTLNKSGMKGAGPIWITFAWGPAVMLLVFIFDTASGVHFDPALTIVLAVDGSLAWTLVLGYIVTQFTGAFTGAVLVYLLLKDQFDATESAVAKLGVFSTRSSVPNMEHNILSEVIGTFVLVFAIKGIGQVAGIPAGIDKLLVFGIIISIGMSLGGLTEYAINPVRNLGPRIAHAVLPIKGKGDSNWGYVPVVIVGPVVDAVAAALLYQAIPWA